MWMFFEWLVHVTNEPAMSADASDSEGWFTFATNSSKTFEKLPLLEIGLGFGLRGFELGS
jgi:hypothetical protein